MAQTQKITIERKPGHTQAEFVPANLTAAAGDVIFWSNTDEQQAHWPAPSADKKTAWMDAEIPRKLPDQPAPTSPNLSFSGATTVSYVCVLHQQETGKITIQ